MHTAPQTVKSAKTYWDDDRRNIFLAISFGWFLSIGSRTAYPVLIPFLREDFGMSFTLAGLLLAVLMFVYAIGQIPGGVLADRFGEGIMMTASMVIASGALVLIAMATSVPQLFLGTAALAASVSLLGVVRFTALADTYPEHVGTIHGFHGSIGDVGNTVIPPIVMIIAAATFWQSGIGVLIPIFLIVALTLWLVVPGRTSPSAGTSGSFTLANFLRLCSEMRDSRLLLATIIMIISLITTQSYLGFYPTYLIEVKGMSSTIAGSLFALHFALGVLVRPIAGYAYDQVGVRFSLFIIIAGSGIGFVFLPLVDGFWPLVVVTCIIAVMSGRGTVVMAYLTVSLNSDIQNSGLGFIRTIYFLFGAASPPVFGAIADVGYFDEGFWLLAGLAAISLLIIVQLPRTTGS